MKNKTENSTNPLTVKAFKQLLNDKKAQVIDTRLPDNFEMGNIPGAINFGFNLNHGHFTQLLFKIDTPILIACKASEEEKSYATLREFGFTQILGHLEGGMDAWLKGSEKYDMVISISSEELALDSKHNPKAITIDTREADEFNTLHVGNALNMPLTELTDSYGSLNKLDEVLIYSNNGFRSMIAASFLKKEGFANIKNVWGGFEKIKQETVDLVGKK
ncbi:MAG: rhodanese-like domain-containing protein [bacterium]|nr:rhodanese-like domain-containing protein [bacterium]